MARGFKDSSIIGGALDRDVLVQLNERSKILSKRTGRTSKEISFLNSKTGWVKLSSAVDVFSFYAESDNGATPEYSSVQASRNVLFGGVLADKGKQKAGFRVDSFGRTNPDTAYRKSEVTGLRPMPGITSVSINSKNTFGTLREAKVEFNVWSVEELTVFEKLYMRPGFSVLLEWGNTMYVDNKGNIESNIQTISDFFSESYLENKERLQGYINQLKVNSGYNYDGFLGYVKNFQWSYNIDGGYDCSCDIITFGEIIESIKVIVTPTMSTGDEEKAASENDKGETEVNKNIKSIRTPLHSFLYAIKEPETGGSDFTGPSPTATIKRDCPKLLENLKRDLGPRQFSYKDIYLNGKEDDKNTTPKKFSYIKLRDLLVLLNNSFMYGEKKDKRLIEFNTEEPRSLFYTFPDHSGLDLGVCFTPKNYERNLTYRDTKNIYLDPRQDVEEYMLDQVDKKYKNFSQKRINFEKERIKNFIPEYESTQSCLNIYVNVDIALEELDRVIDSNQVSAQSLLNYVKNILQRIQRNLGDVNQFDLVYDEEIFQYFVVDRTLVPDNIQSKIDLTGLRSMVSNLSFSSKITPKLASMIAVSAQAGGSDVGLDTENMFRWNEGLRDRIKPKLELNPDNFEGTQIDTLVENIRTLSLHFKEFNKRVENGGKYYSQEVVRSLFPLFSSVMRRLATIHTNTGSNGAKGIIPFELNLTLEGIAGIKIGQAFTVNEGILPSTYNDVIAFLVNRVDHKIQQNRWITEISAQTIVIDKKPSAVEAEPALLTDIIIESLEEAEIFDPFDPNPTPDQRKTVSELQVSQDTLNLIKRFEGFEDKAYVDPGSLGKPITIGYGTTRINGAPITLGQTITESEAERYLRTDVNKFAEDVRKLVKVKLTENEFGALVSFAYNVGPGNLQASTLLRNINEQRYIAGSNQFLRWTKASGKELKGLIKRRQAEKQLFLKANPGDPK